MKAALARCLTPVALLGALASVSTSQAQTGYFGAYETDIRQTVARVAYFSGDVLFSRGDDPDDWQLASLNFPMTWGDRVYTERGSRLELQTEGSSIYLAPKTDLAVLNLTYDVKQLSLGMGSASFRIRHMDQSELFEVDTPNCAVTLDGPGEYRIDVNGAGNTRVTVTRGYVYVAAAGGEVPLDAGRQMVIDGIDHPFYDVMRLPRQDPWDRWVASRSRRSYSSSLGLHVNLGISGIDDLYAYGGWSQVPGYGTCWSPTHVSRDWQPYRDGRWVWQDPWGWTWVSEEPWGWAPYHYGRWVMSRSRWYWVPVAPDVRTVRYAPALVAFVGGPGFSISIAMGGGAQGGFVGWFPLAPRDPFIPWWGSGARAQHVTSNTNVTNVSYVNRAHVTVVNQKTFVAGEPVRRNMVRDTRIVREISAAPVARGAIQVVPLASSIRVSPGRARSTQRPPAEALNRAVVTRLTPPPAPATFRDKESLISENRGAPVAPAEAARLPVKGRAVRANRSVVVEGGRVALAPKNAHGVNPTPVAVTREIQAGRVRRGEQPADVRKPQPSQAPSTRAPAPAPAPIQHGRGSAQTSTPTSKPAARGRDAAQTATPTPVPAQHGRGTAPTGRPTSKPAERGRDSAPASNNETRGRQAPERQQLQTRATGATNAETFVGKVTAYEAGKRIEILSDDKTRHSVDLSEKDLRVSVVGTVAVGAQVRLVRERGDHGMLVSIMAKNR